MSHQRLRGPSPSSHGELHPTFTRTPETLPKQKFQCKTPDTLNNHTLVTCMSVISPLLTTLQYNASEWKYVLPLLDYSNPYDSYISNYIHSTWNVGVEPVLLTGTTEVDGGLTGGLLCLHWTTGSCSKVYGFGWLILCCWWKLERGINAGLCTPCGWKVVSVVSVLLLVRVTDWACSACGLSETGKGGKVRIGSSLERGWMDGSPECTSVEYNGHTMLVTPSSSTKHRYKVTTLHYHVMSIKIKFTSVSQVLK